MDDVFDPDELFEFIKNSQRVFLPENDTEKRKTIKRLFRDSCMIVKNLKGDYFVGQLNRTSSTGYSMTVNGKEMQFSYSNKEEIFKPKLC